MIFMTLFWLMMAFADSEKFDPRYDIFSNKYEAGPYLLYDCEAKHWVCTEEITYKECEEKRKAEVLSDVNTHHSCAPVGKFVGKKSCYDRQLFMVSQNFGSRVCVRDVWKNKVVRD